MNNLSINRTHFNRGDAEARRKTWSEVANLRSGRVIVTRGPTSQSSSASPRLRGLRPFVHSCFNLPPGRCVAQDDTGQGEFAPPVLIHEQ